MEVNKSRGPSYIHEAIVLKEVFVLIVVGEYAGLVRLLIQYYTGHPI